jgi:hypothetical protein
MKKSQMILAGSAFVLAISSAFTMKPNMADKDFEGYFTYTNSNICEDSGVMCSTTGMIRCTTSIHGVDRLFEIFPNSTCSIPLFADPD